MPNITMSAPASTIQGPGGPYIADVNGNISVPSQLVPALIAAGCLPVFTNSDYAYFGSPTTPDLVSIVAAVLPVSGTAFTIAAQTTYACKMQVRGVYSGAVANLVVNLVGIDGRGNAITETVNMAAASSTTFLTVNAYAKLTSATPVGTVTNVTTIGIGHSGALGLPLPPAFTGLVVFKETVAANGSAVMVDEAVGTVDAVAGTVTPTSAPTGAKCFGFWYGWNQVS
jgi:hypothetical protein